MRNYKTKEEDVAKISTSIFVTNFPESFSAKDLFHSNVGAGSWFSVLQQAEYDFTVEGRIVWDEVEEVSGWIPKIMEVSDDDEQSVEDVKGGDTVVHEVGNHGEDSDVDKVPETMFDESSGQKKKQSEDPFGIYPLLDKQRKVNSHGDTSNENVEKQNGDREQNNNVEEPLNGRDDCSDNMGTKPDDLDSGCSGRFKKSVVPRTGGSILCLMEEVVKVGKTMGYNMEGLAQKAKKDWVKELCISNKVNFLTLQETKMESMELITIKSCWGNYAFDYVHSDTVGVWVKTGVNLLIVTVYAPHDLKDKCLLWDYLTHVSNHCNASLEEVPLGGCAYTWCHKSASKMSKLDRFLISENLMHKCPNICAITLDRFILDHRPILFRESSFDYGPTPFRFFHYWMEVDGFNEFVIDSWMAELIRLKGELQAFDGDIDNGNGSDKVEELECDVSKEELKRVVWDCGMDKSPGPNGFTFGFFRKFWSTIENDVYEAVTQILDGPFILNEVMHWCTVKNKQALHFKVDFEKAYDSVKWDFLDEVFKKFRFGNKWRMWIQSSLRSSRGSILVNGSPMEEF
nr:RNA-directed DNA polymerase, eukaryota [Tanacetum cinerariifolium]